MLSESVKNNLIFLFSIRDFKFKYLEIDFYKNKNTNIITPQYEYLKVKFYLSLIRKLEFEFLKIDCVIWKSEYNWTTIWVINIEWEIKKSFINFLSVKIVIIFFTFSLLLKTYNFKLWAIYINHIQQRFCYSHYLLNNFGWVVNF